MAYGMPATGASCIVRSGLQKTVADSSAKAETIELYNCTRELVHLHHLFEPWQFGMPLSDPITLYEDNSSAISIVSMKSSSTNSHHFEVKYFYVTDQIHEGLIDVKKYPTDIMLADGLTKALPPRRFREMEYWLQGLHNLSREEVAALGYAF